MNNAELQELIAAQTAIELLRLSATELDDAVCKGSIDAQLAAGRKMREAVTDLLKANPLGLQAGQIADCNRSQH